MRSALLWLAAVGVSGSGAVTLVVVADALGENPLRYAISLSLLVITLGLLDLAWRWGCPLLVPISGRSDALTASPAVVPSAAGTSLPFPSPGDVPGDAVSPVLARGDVTSTN